MATRKTATLALGLATDIATLVRASKSRGGPSTAVTPYAGGKVDCSKLWLEIVTATPSPIENEYAIKVYDQPYGGSSIYTDGHNPIGWNRWEGSDTATSKSGYTIVPVEAASCDDYIDMEDLPKTVRYKILAYVQRGEKWGFVFMERADPIVKGPA